MWLCTNMVKPILISTQYDRFIEFIRFEDLEYICAPTWERVKYQPKQK